jgi:hypothetical protein
MRWRRVVAFAAIIAAHWLVLWLFPSGYAPREPQEDVVSFATLTILEPITEQASQPAPLESENAMRAARVTERRRFSHEKASSTTVSEPERVLPSNTAPALTDWAKEAQIAADDSIKSDATASRQAGALTDWKSRVMPSPTVPAAPTFSWDYAATHRFESSALGLIVNLNDRCSLLISLSIMAVMGGCKLGQIPVRGDLFMHMKDEPAASSPTR